MSTYLGSANRPERARAVAAVIAVHLVLAAIIFAGLNVRQMRSVAERLETFDIAPPAPPPVRPPPPEPRPTRERLDAGAPAPKARATAVVSPPVKLPLPSPVVAAKVADSGAAPTSGAADAGNGSGAGGSGNGPGGGGAVDYSRFTPARLVRNLTRGDYRTLAAGRLPAGRAVVSLRIEPSGVASQCTLLRSSGDPVVDSGLCPLISARLGFRPALDDQGRPIPYRLQYVATWAL